MKANFAPVMLLPLAVAAWLATGSAHAQKPPAGTSPKGPQPDICLQDISNFQQSLALVRQTSGEKAATELKEKLLPASLENEILVKSGSCGLSKHLREKKLV